MKTKLCITLMFIGALASAARAQSNDDPTARKLYLDFGGSVGLFIPYDQVKGQKTLTGSNAMTLFSSTIIKIILPNCNSAKPRLISSQKASFEADKLTD
jgi:hypothetical protein